MPISHIIYDCDGLLLDTERLNQEVNGAIAARYGKTFTDEVHHAMIGRPSMKSSQIMVKMLDLPLSAQEYLEERDQMIRGLYKSCNPLPGAKELTLYFYKQGVPQAIATSSEAVRFNKKMSRHQEWLALFNCIVTGDDAEIKQGKPAPDIFLITARRLGAMPSDCLVFEDSLAGVTAAKAAGMTVVAVPGPTMAPEAFYQADSVIPSLFDFDPPRWGLPYA
ncbi:MAG: HAD-IA family hydrolase [Cyanobacteria bacterium P01_F01_bin.150]